MSRSKKGFTLAEVLITLLIIGVVASLVIPALIGDTQQAELKVGLKKAVSSANQALAMSIAQDATDSTAATDAASLMNIFANKLNVIQSSVANATMTTADGMVFKFYRGSSVCSSSTDSAASDVAGTAPCYALVDINGSKKPNADSASANTFKDQYYLVIKSKSVIPAKGSNGSDIAQQAMYN